MAVKSLLISKPFALCLCLCILVLMFFFNIDFYIGAGLIIAYYLIVKKSNVWNKTSTELSRILA